MKRVLVAMAAVMVLVSGRVEAGVFDALVTSGQWSAMPAPTNNGTLFWDNTSADCNKCAAGWILEAAGGGWEYLHAAGDPTAHVGFGWLGPLPDTYSWSMGITDWTNGSLTHADSGSWDYSSGTGRYSSSWQGTQGLLVRRQEGLLTRVRGFIEDILFGDEHVRDGDYNDAYFEMTFTERRSLIPPPEPPVVPEPSSLLLFGIGLSSVGVWSRRSLKLQHLKMLSIAAVCAVGLSLSTVPAAAATAMTSGGSCGDDWQQRIDENISNYWDRVASGNPLALYLLSAENHLADWDWLMCVTGHELQ